MLHERDFSYRGRAAGVSVVAVPGHPEPGAAAAFQVGNPGALNCSFPDVDPKRATTLGTTGPVQEQLALGVQTRAWYPAVRVPRGE